MRLIHKFKYKNKFFKCGELTVGDYMLSIEDFEQFLEKILLEFNDKIPKLDERYTLALLDILFDRKQDAPMEPERTQTNQQDFHIIVGIFMRQFHQGFGDVCQMPLRVMNKMLDDMECIMDPSKYDPERHNPTPDRKKIKETF